MCNSYESLLNQVDFFGLYHPEYLPYIGDRYDEYRILHIGESHYIPQQKNEPDVFPASYFEKWWSNSCNDLKEFNNQHSEGYNWVGWFRTQSVIDNYLAGNRTRAHGIFTELVKAFSLVYQNRIISHITTEESQNYNHFAFMNFFQMPSLYKGEKFWNSVLASAKRMDFSSKKDARDYASKIWGKAVEESTKIVDCVIDIVQPEIIIFTSNSAWKAYNGKHKESPRIIATVHPGCKFWNNPNPGQVGKAQLVEKWAELLRR